MKPNKYQEAILNWVANGSGDALIEARAGCGKTTTLLQAVDLIISELGSPVLLLAFNSHIAKEMKAKIQGRAGADKVEAVTVNSIGSSFIWSYGAIKYTNEYGDGKLFSTGDIDQQKYVTIAKNIVGRELTILEQDFIEDEERNDIVSEFARLIDLARETYIPIQDPTAVEALIRRYRLFENVNTYGINFPVLTQEAIDRGVAIFNDPIYNSRENKYIHRIDYIDQVYLPLRLNMAAPGKVKNFGRSFILVDEAQDLSNAQQRLLKKCTTKFTSPRYIFVADKNQAIYGFAGADTRSIDHLSEKFNLHRFPLNICYRCPSSHIPIIQKIVPDIEGNPDAIEGEVHFIDNEEIASLLQPGDYVIARRNKDLVEILLEALRQGKSIFIKDADLVRSTLSGIRKLNCKDITTLKQKIRQLQFEFQEQQKDPLQKGAVSAISNDTADIFDAIFILVEVFEEKDMTDDIHKLIKFVEKILNVESKDNSIVFSSVHAIKGGEAERVFVVSYNRFPYFDDRNSPDQNQQEVNLQYIALSRSKNVMYLCRETKENTKDISDLTF